MKVFRVKTPARAISATVSLIAKSGKGLDDKTYVFCESRSSLSYEMGICSALGGSFSVSVGSFARYVGLHAKTEKYLGKTAATLVVRRIIEENPNSLVRLKRGTANLAVNVYNIISQLKAAKVTVDDLKSVVENEQGAFKSKLADIVFIYGEYEKFVKDNGYIDENEYISLMPELLRGDNAIRGAKVIVSGISTMTKSTVDILLTLEKITDLTVVTVSHDAPGYSNEIYYKMLQLFGDCEVFDDQTLSFEQETIINGLFDPQVFKKTGGHSDKIRIFEYPDVNAEVHAVAKRIRYEVVENGRRYGDFVIASENVPAYAPLIRRVFAEYDIPVYADVKKSLSAHPLVALLLGLIDCKRLNFKPSVCLATVKNPCGFSAEEADAFENYFMTVTPSRKMMANKFSENVAENVRQKLYRICSDIPTKSTVNGYIDLFLNIFVVLDTVQKTAATGEALSARGEDELCLYNTLAEKAFYETLNETRGVMGDAEVDLTLFRSLLTAAFGASEISTIATHYDGVFFGDVRTAPLRVADVLFFIGFDSSVPSVKADTALLCDKELTKLEGYQCVLEPKLRIVNIRERENVMTTLASFDKNLYVSYARLGFGGEKNVRSELTEYFESMFDLSVRRPIDEKLAHIGEGESVFDYLSPSSALNGALKAFEAFRNRQTDVLTLAAAYEKYAKEYNKSAYNFINEYFSKENGTVLPTIRYDGNVSATMIETYFTCPYKAFGERMLNLKDTSTGDTASYEVGQMFHEVLQKFVPECEKISESDVEAVSLRLIGEVFGKEEYARYLNKKKYEYIYDIIRKEIVAACKKVYSDMSASDFKLLGTEIPFNDSPQSMFKAVRLDTVRGEKRLNGIIDRVDKFGDYARIIDYKTGDYSKKVYEKNLYFGVSIQLYLYMLAMQSTYKLAAAHYLSMTDGYVKQGDSNLNYAGNTVADDGIIAHLDKKSDDGVSKTYGIKRTKGELSGMVLTEEEMKKYVDYAREVAVSGANEIYEGVIVPTPIEKKKCEYCGLCAMCGYDAETGKYTRDTDAATKEVLLKAVESKEK